MSPGSGEAGWGRHARRAGPGEGTAVPAVATRGRCALTQHVDLHIGAHGELGESGDRLLPGGRCCGEGGGWGERRGQSGPEFPPPATAGE